MQFIFVYFPSQQKTNGSLLKTFAGINLKILSQTGQGPNAIRNNKQTTSTQKRNAIEIIKRKKTAMSSTTFEGIRTISCI